VTRDYKELDVWNKSVDLAIELYKLTARFDVTERYGMTSQIRRAGISIPGNIAEGWGRGSRGEYTQFLTIARGSLMELETHLIIASKLQFIEADELVSALKKIKDIEKMLNRLIAVLKTGKRDREPASSLLNPESRIANPVSRAPVARIPRV